MVRAFPELYKNQVHRHNEFRGGHFVRSLEGAVDVASFQDGTFILLHDPSYHTGVVPDDNGLADRIHVRRDLVRERLTENNLTPVIQDILGA